MIFHEFKNVKLWTWKDLHKKIVQVIYSEANPDTMEPAMLGFHDIENNVTYLHEPDELREKLKRAEEVIAAFELMARVVARREDWPGVYETLDAYRGESND